MTPINILIVDDREENIVALEALLAREDIRLFSTTSPNEALKMAWENNISIAVVDVQMPEMDGFELARMLKSNHKTKDIFIIFVTAISKETKYAVKGFGTGAVDYLYKPLDPYITSAKVDAFIQLARTQSELKTKNTELQNYATVIKNSADIICAVNAQNLRLETINPAVEKILGHRPAEILGKSIIDFAVEEDKADFRKKLGEIIKDNINYSVSEYRFETFGKQKMWVECRMSFTNKTIFLNISDISPQKSYQEQLIKSKELAEYGKKVKESFLANMSHELRTPLNGIIGLINLLQKTNTTEQQDGMLDLLQTSSNSLLAVINDILDISKMEAGKFSINRAPSNLRHLLKSICDLLKFKADEKNIEFLTTIDKNVPEYINVDGLRINQILMNLLSNAIKFTDKGYVKLNVSVLQKHNDKVKLRFTVEDSGIGIPAESLSTVFNSFEQAEDDTTNKYGGTGLGLAIVKKLIELKGGDLTVNSQIGKGSVFNFTNWYSISSKPKKETKSQKHNNELEPFDDIKILIAEDNLVNQFMLSKILKDWKASFDMVDNGRKALDKLTKNNYDIILMDTHMPVMGGYEAARSIRVDFNEPKRSVPIISLSAQLWTMNSSKPLMPG